ncbi:MULTISPECIES: NCS2 family permease [Clostridium]|uniref:Guanine/hypoxanthine permease PbuG n=2 Tax=Clostridium TaxID=1485 RepID=A0A6V8SGF4_9CLOT|nr:MULTISPECIES: NCS2 family permease [Clostridium]GFP75555.1 Guanine/hypoxanthine permease PbuG [Clostridium fungisolvens]GKU27448.1 NCS2 family permease [Clostridium folliculivorans]GKU32300.1 NCS2 family permease [Clostridium folliculivorans]
MEKFFKLKQYGTNVRTEVIAGLTTFFTMAYIIFVNPSILQLAGTADNPFNPQGIFVATIISAVVGTLVMGLFANVPYALAPGMGLNAFFTFTVCGTMGFTWQQALAMVFICGVVNIIITVTGLRKIIIRSLPSVLQKAIGGGIGLFIAYIGIKDSGLLKFTADPGTYLFLGKTPADATVITNSSAVPALVNFSSPSVQLALLGIILILVLMILRVKAAILIGITSITALTFIEIACGVNPGVFGFHAKNAQEFFSSANISLSGIGTSIGAVKYTAFKMDFAGLFADGGKLLLAITAMIAFILTDIFDALGTFIGTGRRAGIFDAEDEKLMLEGKGVKSRLDKALFADLSATIVGAFFGTSNTTTYVESSAGIAAGGRTGLSSVVTSIMFLVCLIFAPVIGIIPSVATAPALVVVGILMMSSIGEIDWKDLSVASVAFLTIALMPFAYSITTGIAFGFISYVIIAIVKKETKGIHPVIYLFTGLFILNFVLLAIRNL